MELIKNIATLALLYGAIALIASSLAYLATEAFKRPLFRFKPFNCLPCLSFWLAFMIGCIAAIMLRNFETAPLLVLSFATGLINYFYNRSKIKIYG